jgi:hypothetical protein
MLLYVYPIVVAEGSIQGPQVVLVHHGSRPVANLEKYMSMGKSSEWEKFLV